MIPRTVSPPTVALVALVALGALGATLAWSPAARADDDTKRRTVILLLSGYEYEPTLEDWERVGPDANRILVDVIGDRMLRPSLRLKALASLAWFPSKRSRAVLDEKLHGGESTDIERRVATRTLALAFGAEVVPDLQHFLQSPDRSRRESAIRALGLIRTERVRGILRTHLEGEEDLDLRLLTDDILAAFDRPAPRPPILPRPAHRPPRPRPR